jgi:putative oxidoreductase
MTAQDVGRLLLRLAIGGLMLLHGIAKLRHGIDGMPALVAAHGLPRAFAYLVYAGELIAPLCVLVGVVTRPAAAIIAVDMAFAVWLAHTHDLARLGAGGGYALELQSLYLAGALAIALLGAGRFAIAGALGRFN